jgi:hypothetical protein
VRRVVTLRSFRFALGIALLPHLSCAPAHRASIGAEKISLRGPLAHRDVASIAIEIRFPAPRTDAGIGMYSAAAGGE